MFLKLLLSFCQPFLHGWSWKTHHLLDVVQFSRSWELKVSGGWWIPASSCSMEKDDLMCLGCFLSCCAHAAGSVCTLCQRHLECVISAVVCTHLPCSPEILWLIVTPAHVHWPFLRGCPIPFSQKSGQILCREGRRTKWEHQTESESYLLGSSVLPVTLSCAGSGVF